MGRQEDHREVIMADGSIVLSDLVTWLHEQHSLAFHDRLSEDKRRRLDSIQDGSEHTWQNFSDADANNEDLAPLPTPARDHFP